MKKQNNSDTTTAVKLLNQYGFSMRLIGRLSQTAEYTVRRALSLEQFRQLRPLYLKGIRDRVERLLMASDWDGDPSALWAEYDEYDGDASEHKVAA